MRYSLWMLALTTLFLSGCGDPPPIEITQVREIDPANDFELPVVAESDAQRFRFRTQTKAQSPHVSSGRTSSFTWKVPEGWKELSPTSMRNPNLRFGENDESECYVTRLSGTAGGMVANVNRWRKQMGAEELTEAEVNDLPKKTLLGQPATLVSVDGDYGGMGSTAKGDYRLQGLILITSDSMITVKMIGPKALVSGNEAKFDAFCASLARKSPGN